MNEGMTPSSPLSKTTIYWLIPAVILIAASISWLWITIDEQRIQTILINQNRNSEPLSDEESFDSEQTADLVPVKTLGLTATTVDDSKWDQSQRPGSDWPRLLGPQGTGISSETNLLTRWPAQGPPLLWKKAVGTGYSAPSIHGDRLILHSRRGRSEVIESMHATTGEVSWTYSYKTDYRDPYGYNNGPRCTPILTDNRCYTFGAEGKLVCVNLQTGALIWMRDINKEFTVPPHFFGFGCTPLLHGSKLYILAGGQPNSGILCVDAETGKTIWEHVGQETWDGAITGDKKNKPFKWTNDEMLVSYSSPIIAEIHHKPHLLALMRQGLVSVDPETGAENFHYWFRAKVHESVTASQPLVINDTIHISAAYELGGQLLKVAPDGRSVEMLWKSKDFDTHWSSSIYHEGYLYGFCGRHEGNARFRCIDIKDGTMKWETSGFEGDATQLTPNDDGTVTDNATGKVMPYPYFGRASLIEADGKFIIIGERGVVALATPSPDSYQEISRFQAAGIKYPCWPAPVLSRGRMYLRGENMLTVYNLHQNQTRN
jgi:hypothetical protein